ncbi:MAG: nitrogen regulation protein NR(II) [Planctomycetaceae bacterium]
MTDQANDRERERLETQYAEIAALAGGLAHEIRNPLSTIRMNLELMGEDISDMESESPSARRLMTKLGSVQNECERLESILNDFLQFASAGELFLKPANLNAIVEEFIDFFKVEAAEAEVDIRWRPDPSLPLVNLDQKLFRQVLHNLAQNAQQAMPEGGVLEVLTDQRDGQVLLQLIDNGCGMEERTRTRMFQAFYSNKAGGSGLGLPTVRKIVEAHRGQITCESEVGQGTRFTIALPPADE